MVQAQLSDAPTVERAPRTDEVFGAAFTRQGARSTVEVLGSSRAVVPWHSPAFPAAG